MIKVNLSVKDKKNEQFQRTQAEMRLAKKAYVTVGFHSDAANYPDGTPVAMVALWNEFGTSGIPERSFMRSCLDGEVSKINNWRVEAVKNILDGKWSAQKALEFLGFNVQEMIRNKIKSNVPPSNAPSTRDAKARSGTPQRTLIDTGHMLESVSFKVVI